MAWKIWLRRLTYASLFSLMFIGGCNLFGNMHNDGMDSDTSVLMADGNAALTRGDYNNAVVYFNRALDHDAGNSEARVGLAEAMVKSKQFNLADFIKTLMKNSNNQGSGSGSGSTLQLINLADWHCATYAELVSFYTDLINVLDPIALGQTHGLYGSNDLNVNLNVGFIYVLRMAAQLQDLTAVAYQVQQMSKSSTTAAALGISQAQFDLLPESFYWISPTPPATVLTQLQADIDTGIARLRTAAAATESKKMINDMIDMFSSLQVQTH
jgi:hypothetical protein